MNTGFRQNYDLLGFDTGSYSVHFSFDISGQNPISNNSNYSGLSGRLSSVGSFYSTPQSGYFTGQIITVSGVPTGDYWTHIFINKRLTPSGGVLFDSFASGGGIFSGYQIGFNDNNRLYLESYDNFGPVVYTSNLILAKQNCLAVSRSNNAISFFAYDFNNDLLLSDVHIINGNYLLPSNKFIIGGKSGEPSHVVGRNYVGYLDEYVYISDAIIPSYLKNLMSGFVSYSQYSVGSISGISGIEVTGFSFVPTGLTGILGYTNTAVSSGLDDFGDFYTVYSQVPITGYLTSGTKVVSLTGLVVDYVTGASGKTFIIDSGYIESFKYDEVSYLRNIDIYDTSNFIKFQSGKRNVNNLATFDLVNGNFELNESLNDSGVQIYLNGIGQNNVGYAVTGNIYNVGVTISGDYYLDEFSVQSTGIYDYKDIMVYDVISGVKQRVFVTGMGVSGQKENVNLTSNSLAFLNGVLLTSGYQYIKSGADFIWSSNLLSGVTGAISVFELDKPYIRSTGTINFTGEFPRRASMLYLNGQRQLIDTNYIENSTIDLIGQSGIFDLSVELVYNNNELFWE